MTWLLVGLFVSTFAAILLGSFVLRRDAERAGSRELNQAAATFALSQRARAGWSSARVFCGSAEDFELTWTLTPKRVGRDIELRVRHPNLEGGGPSADALAGAGLPDGARLTFGEGFIELSFEDVLGNDARELVPATRRLLALARTSSRGS